MVPKILWTMIIRSKVVAVIPQRGGEGVRLLDLHTHTVNSLFQDEVIDRNLRGVEEYMGRSISWLNIFQDEDIRRFVANMMMMMMMSIILVTL